MSDKITGIGSCDGCGGGGVGDWSVTTKLLDGHYGHIRDNTFHIDNARIGKIEIDPRRVECKDCTYWNPEHRNAKRKWDIGVCEKNAPVGVPIISSANAYCMPSPLKETVDACYEGHYDANLWPKRNILMRKF